MTVPSRRIAVIGAGAVGANIAYRLASRGAEVTVIEAGRPGLGTSASSISWLSSFPQIADATPAMVAYRRRSNDLFRELVNEIGGDWMHWTGTLTWSDLPTSASRLRRDFAAMLMISRLLEAARKLGATVLEKSPALAVQRAGSGIVVTTATAEVDADVVPELAGSAPAGSAVGIRPVPPGGPVIGWHPSFAGLFIAVSHGGIGWGPLWGRIATEMIIDGHREIAAEAFAADRFFRPSDRYPSRHVRMREGVL